MDGGMKKPPDPSYRHRFPVELPSHAVWLYRVLSLSFRDVKLILAERGGIVSYESIRRWCQKSGASLRTIFAGAGRGRVTSSVFRNAAMPRPPSDSSGAC